VKKYIKYTIYVIIYILIVLLLAVYFYKNDIGLF